MITRLSHVAVALIVGASCCSAVIARPLDLDERIRAQEAIDRVYYAHQIGASRSLDEAVPREGIERKVRAYLERSMALGDALTTEALDGEVDRMRRNSRMPERLVEIFAALRNDPLLIRECLARPLLVARIVRKAANGSLLPQVLPGCADDQWLPMAEGDPVPGTRGGFTMVWTGSFAIVWGGDGAGSSTGGRYDPATDSWLPTSTVDAPSGRRDHAAVWTGDRMLVWGGYDGSFLNSGGLYDPVADDWQPMSTVDAPAGRSNASAVWTGTEMIVWGGYPDSGTGGRYEPASDSWSATTTTGAPSARSGHTAIWTGSRMIVWGGTSGIVSLASGGSYDPAMDSWSPVPTSGAAARDAHTAVWTGTEMIVWGGEFHDLFNPPPGGTRVYLGTGDRYDPASGTWAPTAYPGPASRKGHTAVWTGGRMVVWGGSTGSIWNSEPTATGGQYDPVADQWTPTSTTDAPAARLQHAAVWMGNEMLVWGGSSNTQGLASGGLYVPDAHSDADGDGFSVCEDCDDMHPTVYPGAPQLCDGLDNDCNDPLWPTVPVSEHDDDMDGVLVCQGDCDDSDAWIWSVPGEVVGVAISHSSISWLPPAAPGGAAPAYDTIRSTNAAEFLTAAVCVESNDDADTSAADATIPALHQVFFYLVRAENGCGAGPLGAGSDGTPRAARTCP